MSRYVIEKFNFRIGFWDSVKLSVVFDPSNIESIKQARYDVMATLDTVDLIHDKYRVTCDGHTEWTPSRGWCKIHTT
jgi:hypothetical protein